ncbi:large ribosomal subunit protein eL38 isoform X3 [Oryctolagus cuniculus]|uniref:large ribosomal subunit protein eL38 isoform X3 n=1 Tax=Oryctolagus cuniculus TaxID=9986 RepID=UPI00387A5FEC
MGTEQPRAGLTARKRKSGSFPPLSLLAAAVSRFPAVFGRSGCWSAAWSPCRQDQEEQGQREVQGALQPLPLHAGHHGQGEGREAEAVPAPRPGREGAEMNRRSGWNCIKVLKCSPTPVPVLVPARAGGVGPGGL